MFGKFFKRRSIATGDIAQIDPELSRALGVFLNRALRDGLVVGVENNRHLYGCTDRAGNRYEHLHFSVAWVK